MSREPGGSRTSADQTEYARAEMTVSKVDEGVSICGGDDELAKEQRSHKVTRDE